MEESQIAYQNGASTSREEVAMAMLSLGHVMEVKIKFGGHGKRDRTVKMMMSSTTCYTMQPTFGAMDALLPGLIAMRMARV